MAEEVSGTTRAVLAMAAVSAAIFALWLCSLVVRAIRAVAARRPAAKPKASAAAPSQQQQHAAAPSQQQQRAPKKDLKALIKEAERAKRAAAAREDPATHHPLFVAALKGHTDAVGFVSWSRDGRRLATACEDLAVRVFEIGGSSSGGGSGGGAKAEPKLVATVRTQQAPLACGFGNADGEVVAVLRDIPDQARLALFAPSAGGRAPGGGAAYEARWQTPKALETESLFDAAIVPGGDGRGGIAALLSAKKFGRVLDLAGGRPLGAFEPNSLGNHALAASADGRFVAVASFSSEVKVWEVERGRDGLRGVARAMELKGHTRKVTAVAIAPDGARAVTASEDGTLRVWRLDVRYHLQEDAKAVLSVPLERLGLAPGESFRRLALGPGGVIAAAHGGFVHFIDGAGGALLAKVHAHEGPIACMAWAPARVALGGGEECALLATCSGEARVRVWRSPKAAAA